MTDSESTIFQIRDAFRGIELGDGIGLKEGGGIDGYLTHAECKELRLQDEKSDWSRIPAEDLIENECSLSYFDPEGMRFHLPAFMIAYINMVPLYGGVVFSLTDLNDFKTAKLALLSFEQRMAVRSFLQYVADHPDGWLSVEDISTVLNGYWSS